MARPERSGGRWDGGTALPWCPGTFEPEALGADGNAAIGADLERSADTPNIRPPRAARGGAQDGALFLLGEFPGLLRGHAQFAMDFVGVVMESQSIDVWVGGFDVGNVLTGEIGGSRPCQNWCSRSTFPLA